MLVTDQFVMLNFPKTGSSFAREAIKRVYAQRQSKAAKLVIRLRLRSEPVVELMCPNIDAMYSYGIPAQHGTARQIPTRYRDKPIVSIARDPFSRYTSAYHFGWWKKYPPGDESEIRCRYPHFPNLSFEDFYEMSHEFGAANRLKELKTKMDIGIHTIQFVRFYFREPERVLQCIDEQYIRSGRYKEDMEPIQFLHQESLRKELQEFLLGLKFRPKELEFISRMSEINKTKAEQRIPTSDLDDLITPDTRECILERDGLLFAMFPEYDPRRQVPATLGKGAGEGHLR